MHRKSRWLVLLAMLLASGLGMAAAPVPVPAKAPSPTAPAQELAGTWQGKLQVDPKTAVTIRFTFARKPDGAWSAVLSSSEGSGELKNVAADSVAWKNGTVDMQVTALSGSYHGTLANGSIQGQWTQPGGVLSLVLTPYQKPQLSKATVDLLVGSWNGPVALPGTSLTFVVRFKLDDKGELQGTLAVPEQGGTELPLSDIQFVDNKLDFKVSLVGGEYTATYTNGSLNGSWRQGSPPNPPAGLPVGLKKGEYAAQAHVLKLSVESFVILNGRYEGSLQVTTPQGPLTLPIVLRIMNDERADIVGFIDSPKQHVNGIPVSEATFAAGKLVIKVAALNVEYDATLSGNTLSGEWKQGPSVLPLSLTRQ